LTLFFNEEMDVKPVLYFVFIFLMTPGPALPG